jgi:hypothetical protein
VRADLRPARVGTERGLDRFVTFLDAVVAIAITLLVLPLTELLRGSKPGDSLGSVLALLYIGTITVSSGCLTGIAVPVWRRPALRRRPDESAPAPWASFASTGTLVVALLIGTFVRSVNYGAMLLLLLTGPVEALLSRGRSTARVDAAAG